MSSRKKFTVTRGYSSIEVSPYKKGWRFIWREKPSDPWSETTRRKKEDAVEAAVKRLELLASGTLDFDRLPPERRAFLERVHLQTTAADEAPVLEYLASRKKSGLLADAVTRFISFKTASKGETDHLAQVRRDLEALAVSFAGNTVMDVTLPELEKWWFARAGTAGNSRKLGIRTTLGMFWRWCRKDGIAGNDVDTIADRLPPMEADEGRLFILELPELEFLLATVEKQWFPLIVLGAFQGLRPEEIAPKQQLKGKFPSRSVPARKRAAAKPGLRWEHIDWQWNSIVVPREVSKTYERKMPLHPVTRAWLEAFGAGPGWTGPICPKNPSQTTPRATTEWGRKLTEKFPERFPDGWESDALRHSFASYRHAVLHDLAKVAEEMGTSDTMLHGHYLNPRLKHQGEAFFDFLPSVAGAIAPYLKVA